MLACGLQNRVAIMAIMRSLIVGAALAGVLAGCLAGTNYAKAADDSPVAVEQSEKKKAAEAIDRQYKSTLERTRKDTPAVRADPWQSIRGPDDSKPKR